MELDGGATDRKCLGRTIAFLTFKLLLLPHQIEFSLKGICDFRTVYFHKVIRIAATVRIQDVAVDIGRGPVGRCDDRLFAVNNHEFVVHESGGSRSVIDSENTRTIEHY